MLSGNQGDQRLHLYPEPTDVVPAHLAEKLQRDVARYWERFYRCHESRFFKDRHWLLEEFPELRGGAPTVFEVGCGVGNALCPVLAANTAAVGLGCDVSPTAVECLRAHPQYDPQRTRVWVDDVANAQGLCGPGKARAAGVDFVTLIFVLSAIAPDQMPQVVRNVAACVRTGSGRVLLRDYADADLAHDRLSAAGRRQRVGPDTFVRGDGTLCSYFTQERLRALFEAEGFQCDTLTVRQKTMENRALDLHMSRRWIQAVFTFVGPQSAQHESNGAGSYWRAAMSATAQPMRAEHVPPERCVSGGTRSAGGHLNAAAAASLRSGDEPPEAADAASATRDGKVSSGGLYEWDASPDEGVPGSDVGGLFQEPAEMVEEAVTLVPSFTVKVSSVGREQKNMCAHTGLMLWEAAVPLARFLLACPSLFQWRRVVELGCGGGGLCAMAGARRCKHYTATDGSPEAVRLLRANLRANAALFIRERVECRQLAWGDSLAAAEVSGSPARRIEVVVGADVVYAEEAVPQLFFTAAALLGNSRDATLVLCHTSRRVGEDTVVSLAADAGFELQPWSEDISQAADAAGIARHGHLRLLVFRRHCCSV